jgi:four helix bundle protein
LRAKNQKINSYQKLEFWKSAYEVTIAIVRLTKKLPKDQATRVIIYQIIRSSASVGANIAEGFGRYKGKEYERFLQISLGSANETEYWLMILKDLHPKFTGEIQKIMNRNQETIKMLASSLKTLRRRKKIAQIKTFHFNTLIL